MHRVPAEMWLVFTIGLLMVLGYSFFSLRKTMGTTWKNPWVRISVGIYFSITVLAWIFFLISVQSAFDIKTVVEYYWGFMAGTLFALCFFPLMLFSLFSILGDSVSFARIKSPFPNQSFIIHKIGLWVAAFLFFLILSGMLWGRFHFKLHEEELFFTDLPSSFDGYTIVQFSDFHAGSSIDAIGRMEKGFEMIQNCNANAILFTGDIVNMSAREAYYFRNHFHSLHAPDGKFAILGNHDYGEYSHWSDSSMLQRDHDSVKHFFAETGFTLLTNSATILYNNMDSIAILGVENWGKPPFKPYGKLDSALFYAKNTPFKILLSHDPSHWELQVKEVSTIQLTLSGHTHGMQIGFEPLGIKWSPSAWIYPRWGGLYQDGIEEQYLYVNRGFGVIGFLARIGMRPEVTKIVLRKAN